MLLICLVYTKSVINMSGMFYNCSSLPKLNLSNFNAGNVENMGGMFYGCASLQTVKFNKNLNIGIKQQLNKLGLMDEVEEEEENKIILKKKQ